MEKVKKTATRIESDLLGEIEVPVHALYGAQTQRAIENFPVGRQPALEYFPTMVQALLLVKKAATITNAENGFLPPAISQAILRSIDTLFVKGWNGQFPIHYLHGGGGTSANMNANEVLANMAEEILGGKHGQYRLVHPNDHVNLHQSTNDVYPTACHIAVILAWPSLNDALEKLVQTFRQHCRTYRNQVHLARTCLQDAVPIHFGDYFGGIARMLVRQTRRLGAAVDALHEVNLGGTICGRKEDVPVAYFRGVIANLRLVTGDDAYYRAKDLFDAAQNPDALGSVSSALDMLARNLVKVAQDLRLLSSGPQAGLGEICLPAVQPGSSIMPGKVNPVIPEFLIQICYRVMGNHAMCMAGLDHGELDLNVWESSMVFPLLEAMDLLEQGVTAFEEKCIRGLEPVLDVNQVHVNTLIPRLTHLAQIHGYRRINEICKQAEGDLEKLERLLDTLLNG
jgi:aspartate ammonia-lyase